MIDTSRGYEENLIGAKGIAYFMIGLLILILVTSLLMWILQSVLEQAAQEDDSQNANPIVLSDRDQLPAEPRLQAAPGFGVNGPGGFVNLELRPPQAEYRELHKIWVNEWRDGMKDPKTGTVVTMPIEQAKEALLQKNLKAASGPDAERGAAESVKHLSDASAGRMASLTER